MRKVGLSAILFLAVGLIACNLQPKVATALDVIGNILSLAQDDLPALQSSGVFTAGDVTAFGNWLSVANTLLGQTKTCNAGLGSGASTGAIAACVNTFATGLLSPAEQANLRIISPGAQKKVMLYVTATILATNFTLDLVNAIHIQTPAVGTNVADDIAPSREELHAVATRIHLSPAFGY